MEELKQTDCAPGSPPTTPCSTATPPASPALQMGLNSPDLLKELKQPHNLKHVSPQTGRTTVFFGRGRPRTQPPSSPGSGNSDTGTPHQPH